MKSFLKNNNVEIVIKNVKNTVPWTYIIGNLNKKKKIWNVLRKLQKPNEKELKK